VEITEIRVFLKEGQDKKLKAYSTVTFDNCFVVRNIKVIEGGGGFFIAMPSRKLKHPCSRCHFKNEVGVRYCGQCGQTLSAQDFHRTEDPKAEHRDVAHPITQEFRDYLQEKVLEVYKQEKQKEESGMDVDRNVLESQEAVV